MTLKVIYRVRAFSNAIRRTFVQHLTRFQLTVCSRRPSTLAELFVFYRKSCFRRFWSRCMHCSQLQSGQQWWQLGRVANPRPVSKIKTGLVSQPITDADDETGRDRSSIATRPWRVKTHLLAVATTAEVFTYDVTSACCMYVPASLPPTRPSCLPRLCVGDISLQQHNRFCSCIIEQSTAAVSYQTPYRVC